MNFLQFIQEFPDEAACRQKFKEERDKTGITCKRCNGKDHARSVIAEPRCVQVQ